MPRGRSVIAALVLGLAALAACGGGAGGEADEEQAQQEGGTDETATCSPSGTELHVAAKDNLFDSTCLAAPANTEFSLVLENQDPFAHNLSIYLSKGGEQLFAGPYVPGTQTQTYEIGPLEPARAYFVCDIHPQMDGTFVVE